MIGTTGNGLLNVTGDATLGGTSQLDILFEDGFVPTPGEMFTIMDMSSLSGEFSNAPDTGFTMDDWNWAISYDSAGHDITLTAESPTGPISTPEPGTLGLLVTGLLGLIFLGRKKLASSGHSAARQTLLQ
jgi:hypothetical protein